MAENSYKQILKVTTLFGGVQLVAAVVGVIKSKCVALLLGAQGVGLHGLLLSTITLINSLANLGLQSSATREIAAADTPQEVGIVASVVKRLTYLTALLTLGLVWLFAPQLGQLIFDSSDYTLALRWLSIALFMDQLSMGRLVLLQGLRQVNYLAKANVVGTILGLLLSLPCYWLWGIDGVVPALILSSIALLLRAWYYAQKLPIVPQAVSWREVVARGGGMVRLGAVMALTSFIGLGATYVVRLYLTRVGGVEAVGYYNAAFMIAESYVGMLFTAMATDYFPRLSKVQDDSKEVSQLIHEQGEIALILLFPAIMLLITAAPLVMRLFYSAQFLVAVPMMRWALLGVLVKAAAFPFGYVHVAKGDKLVFLATELCSWVGLLIAMLLGYHYWGLMGIGVGYWVGYLLYLVETVTVNVVRYGVKLQLRLFLLLLLSLSVLLLNHLVISAISVPYATVISLTITLLSAIFSLWQLNKRMDIKRWVVKKITKKDEVMR